MTPYLQMPEIGQQCLSSGLHVSTEMTIPSTAVLRPSPNPTDPFMKFYYHHFYEHEPIRRWPLKNLPGMKELATKSMAVKFFGGCAISGFLIGSYGQSSVKQEKVILETTK